MTIIKRSALVPYSVQQMYDLVDDISRYSEFLQWCEESSELSRDDDEVVATLHLVWSGFRKSFTTRNRLQHHKMIEIRLENGPFKHLEGFWLFEKLDEQACKVALTLEFEFANHLLSMAFSKIFEQIAANLVDAFLKRAHELYGKS